jgi:hypothetical protein
MGDVEGVRAMAPLLSAKARAEAVSKRIHTGIDEAFFLLAG